MSVSNESAIRAIVSSSVKSFAEGFRGRHEGEVGNPRGTLNMKIHNIFIACLGPEIQYYTALVRSFDSSLGNMLEKMAINIAGLFYEVKREVSGPLDIAQTNYISELLENYRRRTKHPNVSDLLQLKKLRPQGEGSKKRHDSDYYLVDKETKRHYLIELKIGGDLDNKKARSEKEALLEQYAILSNTLPVEAEIVTYFATAYNRFGEEKEWRQERVLQFFAPNELLIGKDFWNFISHMDNGYQVVIDEYKKNSSYIISALNEVRDLYLK